MSWIDDIVGVGKSIYGFVTDGGIGSAIAKTALLGYTVNQASKSVNKSNSTNASQSGTPAVDRGVRLQINPGTENKIPIVYGSAYLSGIVTDAVLVNNNKTMWYCLTICEMPGVKLSDNQQSVIIFEDIYFNDQRVVFNVDGITAHYTLDRDNNVDYSVDGLIKIYCYAGSSNQPVIPDNYNNTGLQPAITVMPGWTSGQAMSDLVFALVRIDYNKEKNINQLPDIKFHINNDMLLPGDCLYDYMTNSRYGAGIDPAEIYSV